jgi:hypothetical protein
VEAVEARLEKVRREIASLTFRVRASYRDVLGGSARSTPPRGAHVKLSKSFAITFFFGPFLGCASILARFS